ncbi:MAG TPA: MarR family winged helix-turn-helix transcriptional regulator [Rhodanobacteraceae bacterium]|nr:MarR family winged helix-turn-helix transcriptional regulator [Rhodanobacteraceae bacterium]
MTPDLFATTRCLCLAARRASRTITRRFDQALRPHGLRATQFTLLAALSLGGQQSISALAELLGNDRTTITRNLGVVAGHGWVRVEPDPADARSRVASITDEGRHALESALATWREVQHALSAEMGGEAVAALHRLAGGPCTLEPPVPTSPEPRA